MKYSDLTEIKPINAANNTFTIFSAHSLNIILHSLKLNANEDTPHG